VTLPASSCARATSNVPAPLLLKFHELRFTSRRYAVIVIPVISFPFSPLSGDEERIWCTCSSTTRKRCLWLLYCNVTCGLTSILSALVCDTKWREKGCLILKTLETDARAVVPRVMFDRPSEMSERQNDSTHTGSMSENTARAGWKRRMTYNCTVGIITCCPPHSTIRDCINVIWEGRTEGITGIPEPRHSSPRCWTTICSVLSGTSTKCG
jgi:hypothetical protein